MPHGCVKHERMVHRSLHPLCCRLCPDNVQALKLTLLADVEWLLVSKARLLQHRAHDHLCCLCANTHLTGSCVTVSCDSWWLMSGLLCWLLTSAYLSQHRARHCCSELPKLLDGLVTHFSKHLSRTVCSILRTLTAGTQTRQFGVLSLQGTFAIKHTLLCYIPCKIPEDTPCLALTGPA